ncbi:hypothetical protein V2H45_13385 [Tumidithrix elongata RA019]|uniref:DoxX family protein n=1 Tax=Tumidithrix elongata BACA0141 TaxID=2716417 RepID=A0AAW9Q3G4_9CYAN|nr:hypothetical protein [Tumidithrix elongata RA019]
MSKLKIGFKYLLALFYVLAGTNHFLNSGFYLKMMPPYLPLHLELIYLSGLCEIALGIMVLIPRLTSLAGWGLIALLFAVFPANIQMALHPEVFPEISAIALWIRLPLQFLLIAWAYWATRPDPVVN